MYRSVAKKCTAGVRRGRMEGGQSMRGSYGDTLCESRRQLKRNNEHLTNRGPPAKIYLDTHHHMMRALNVGHIEGNPVLRKRKYHWNDQQIVTNNITTVTSIIVPGKRFKTNVDDDLEEVRKQFEKWDRDNYKENEDVNVKAPTTGRRIWHIEAYIEQNVYDDTTTNSDETELQANP